MTFVNEHFALLFEFQNMFEWTLSIHCSGLTRNFSGCRISDFLYRENLGFFSQANWKVFLWKRVQIPNPPAMQLIHCGAFNWVSSLKWLLHHKFTSMKQIFFYFSKIISDIQKLNFLFLLRAKLCKVESCKVSAKQILPLRCTQFYSMKFSCIKYIS